MPNALQFRTTVFLSGLEILHGLFFAPFGSGIWWGGLAALLTRLVC